METKTYKFQNLPVNVETFATESEFRQYLYGRNGIHNSITLYFQGKKTDLPPCYDYLKPYISGDYCIIYKK